MIINQRQEILHCLIEALWKFDASKILQNDFRCWEGTLFFFGNVDDKSGIRFSELSHRAEVEKFGLSPNPDG